MRYKLFPTLGTRTTGRRSAWFVEGTYQDALDSAIDLYAEDGIPVVICENPLDGLVKQISIHPPSGKRRKR